MSTWHEVDEGDIDIDSERNEVNFFVCDDRWERRQAIESGDPTGGSAFKRQDKPPKKGK